MECLASNPDDREFVDALLLVGADALYYNAGLALGALGAAGTLGQYMAALSAAVASRRPSGRMRHFSAGRDKKLCALGLTAVLSVPSTALPPGMESSLGQVAAAATAVLTALRTQEDAAAVAAAQRRDDGSDEEEEYASVSAGPGSGSDGDEDKGDDSDDEELAEELRRRLQLRAARRAGHLDVDDDGIDSEEDDDGWFSDEEMDVMSPIDAVSPYIFFADTLQALQGSDPQRLAAMTAQLDAPTQAAVQALLDRAAQIKAEAAAAAAAGAVANGG